MGFSVKSNTKVAVKKETTEGTYEAPAAADFITALEDGLEINGTKEALERDILGTGLTKAQPRTANRSVTGTIPCEFKSGSNDGDAPEYSVLVEAALGAMRDEDLAITTKTGNGSNTLEIEDADISKLNVGDSIIVKEAGAYHISAITAKDSTPGAAQITLLVDNGSSFSDNVQIAPFTTYYTADSDHPTFSITKYIEDAVEKQGVGCRVSTMSIENFVPNQLASLSFAFEGLNFSDALNAPGSTPSFDSSLPPIIVNACLYKNGQQLTVAELTLSVENTIATITSTCSPSGKLGSRISERTISGTLTPYIEDDNIDIQTNFDNDDLFSLFFYAYNPTSTNGEFNQAIAVYLPNCSITELTETDADGLLQFSLSFSASGGTDGSQTEMFMSYI